MDIIPKMDGEKPQERENAECKSPTVAVLTSPSNQSQQQHQQQQAQKTKRKHRRGKPKSKNANKPYKKINWNFQVPRFNYNNNKGNASGGGAGGNANNRNRAKLARSRSLVPYNTNKFLMEEHLADVPSALLTPSGRTRDSSFSVDSEDNYFFSLPEDEEEFLTKEFANVYEKARVERLESLTKQELIEECLQIEDRYSKDQGTQHKAQLNVQRITADFMGKIRLLEEKVKDLSRENYNLRCQLMRSAALAASSAASPPSANVPTSAACEQQEVVPMDSSSEDSESDSSSSSSSSSDGEEEGGGGGLIDQGGGANRCERRRHSCSSRSSLSEYNASIDNNYIGSDGRDIAEEEEDREMNVATKEFKDEGGEVIDYENENMKDQLKCEPHMEDDSNLSESEFINTSVNGIKPSFASTNVTSPNKTNICTNVNEQENVFMAMIGQISNE